MAGTNVRCRGTWKLHLRPSETDKWLDEMGFYRKRIARDASCLFRVISENMYNSQRHYNAIRKDCVHFMANNRTMFERSIKISFELYLSEMSKPTESGGFNELLAMSHMFRRDFVIFEANKESQNSVICGYGNAIFLYYSAETKHFDAVYTKDYINSSSLCQSLVYEVLYEGVFQMQDIFYAVDKMLYDKLPAHRVQYLMTETIDIKKPKVDADRDIMIPKCRHHTLEVDKVTKELLSIVVFNRRLIHLENICLLCLNLDSAKELLDHGIIPFPYKVAKALDPTIYRNIEYDVWIEKCKELQFASRYDGTTLQVGVKCLCRIEPDQQTPYHCHIQQMTQNGPCTVFIEELGEKLTVDYKQLESLPRDELQPWAPPYRLSRAHSQFLTVSQILQQLGNVTRKNYKKGKNDMKYKKSYLKDDCTIKSGDYAQSCSELYSDMEMTETYNLSAYHMDIYNFVPFPVTALPLMVDCRSPGVAEENSEPPHQHENHHNQLQQGASGDMVVPHSGQGAPPAVMPLPPMPAPQHNHHGYPQPGMGYMAPPMVLGKNVWWFPPAFKSIQPNGSDLPMNDIPTLRYYYNLGVDCVWGTGYYPPRPYTPQDQLSQEMSQMSMNERPGPPPPEHNNKHGGGGGGGSNGPDNKHQNKGPRQQGPPMGPRFKRNNYDGPGGNQNMNHNKNYNTMPNKGGPHNNYRRQHSPAAAAAAAAAGEMMPLQYVPYQQLYPAYYPVEHDPNMMGMMGANMGGYYEESVEFSQQYYHPHYNNNMQPPPAALPAPAHPPPPHTQAQPTQHNNEHK